MGSLLKERMMDEGREEEEGNSSLFGRAFFSLSLRLSPLGLETGSDDLSLTTTLIPWKNFQLDCSSFSAGETTEAGAPCDFSLAQEVNVSSLSTTSVSLSSLPPFHLQARHRESARDLLPSSSRILISFLFPFSPIPFVSLSPSPAIHLDLNPPFTSALLPSLPRSSPFPQTTTALQKNRLSQDVHLPRPYPSQEEAQPQGPSTDG